MKNLKLSLSTLTFKATNLEIERWIRLLKFSVRWPKNSFYHKFLALHVLLALMQSKTQNLSCERLWTRNFWCQNFESKQTICWRSPDEKQTVIRIPPCICWHTKTRWKKEILAFTTTTASKFLKNRRNLYHAPKKNHLSSNYWFKKKAFH